MTGTPFTPDYMRGFDQGQKHSSPSPETVKAISEIKEDIKSITNEMKEFIEVKGDLRVLTSELKTIVELTKGNQSDIKGIDERLRNVEQTQSSLVAKIAAVATFVSAIVVGLVNKFIS